MENFYQDRLNKLGGQDMDWTEIGGRIRGQREYLGYTREQFSELLDVTPKFCSDIELGLKGMSIPTLCKIANSLQLSTDYILFGQDQVAEDDDLARLIGSCSPLNRKYLKDIIKSFLLATKPQKESL